MYTIIFRSSFMTILIFFPVANFAIYKRVNCFIHPTGVPLYQDIRAPKAMWARYQRHWYRIREFRRESGNLIEYFFLIWYLSYYSIPYGNLEIVIHIRIVENLIYFTFIYAKIKLSIVMTQNRKLLLGSMHSDTARIVETLSDKFCIKSRNLNHQSRKYTSIHLASVLCS
jgi:hypothetical protein